LVVAGVVATGADLSDADCPASQDERARRVIRAAGAVRFDVS
jgi:hypothetical protein